VTASESNPLPPHWRIAHSEFSSGWGGQEQRVLAELYGFQKRGHKVWLLAPSNSEIFQRAKNKQISVIPLRADKLQFSFEIVRLARWLRQNQIQVLNTHSSRDGWLLGVAGRLARVPFLIRTRHIDVTYPNRWLSRHAYTTFADHVLVTSEKIRKHFQEMFRLPDERITTMSTGIDLELFSPTDAKAKIAAEPSALLPIIGMISVLRSWKGHTIFLKAAAQLKAAGFAGRFIIVGEGPMRPHIEQQIAELKLNDLVTLTGHREDVPDILRALDILVIPSIKHEGVPQIGLQALATRTPVVGSNAGGIPEIIRHGETGRLFPDGDADALAVAIREILHETEATKKMADAGRKLVETRYSLEKMFADLESIYRRSLPA